MSTSALFFSAWTLLAGAAQALNHADEAQPVGGQDRSPFGFAAAPILLDPGHGGDDFGAVSSGYQEKDIALSVARKLRERLSPLPVLLTREEDVYIPLDHRVAQSLATDAAMFVSLHVNQVRQKKLSGITVYAYGRTPKGWHPPRKHKLKSRPPPLPEPAPEPISAGRSLAGSIVAALRLKGFRVDPMARADYYVLKNPKIPSILIELGYMSNPREMRQLRDPLYQDKLADALAQSLRQIYAP